MLGVLGKNGGRKSKFCEDVTRKERAEFLIEIINQYGNLAKTAKEVVSHLGRRVVTSWSNGDDDMAEWNERKGGSYV